MSLSPYADILQNCAELLDKLNRDRDAEILRQAAKKLVTKAAEAKLEEMQSYLDEVTSASNKIDDTLKDIRKDRESINALNQIVKLAGNILNLRIA